MLITLAVKRTGKRRTGNLFAPFDVAGAGDGLTANLQGTKLETADTAKGSLRGTAPVLDPTELPSPTVLLIR